VARLAPLSSSRLLSRPPLRLPGRQANERPELLAHGAGLLPLRLRASRGGMALDDAYASLSVATTARIAGITGSAVTRT
jgi:hypothetical protein